MTFAETMTMIVTEWSLTSAKAADDNLHPVSGQIVEVHEGTPVVTTESVEVQGERIRTGVDTGVDRTAGVQGEATTVTVGIAVEADTTMGIDEDVIAGRMIDMEKADIVDYDLSYRTVWRLRSWYFVHIFCLAHVADIYEVIHRTKVTIDEV